MKKTLVLLLITISIFHVAGCKQASSPDSVSEAPSSGWTRLLGVSGGNTHGNGICVDSGGNSYTTGFTTGALDGQTLTGTQDMFVCKYNSSGTKLWTRLLGSSSHTTQGMGIAVDSSGNCYITGYTDGSLGGQPLTGTQDMFICKYDASGALKWTRMYGAASKNTAGYGIAVDSNGTSYVTGYATSSQDMFVSKYDASGNKLWTKLMGVSGKTATGRGISIDSSGNSYITGYTTGAIAGQSFSGTQAAFVSKYDSSGNAKWTSLFCNVDAGGYGICVDASGNSYITGYSKDLTQSLTDFRYMFVGKYDKDGKKVWTNFLGASNTMTWGYGIAVNASGEIYIAGDTRGALNGQVLTGTLDMFLSKYDSTGKFLWNQQMGTPGKYASGCGIALDQNGTSYIAGWTLGILDGQALTGTQDLVVTTRLNK